MRRGVRIPCGTASRCEKLGSTGAGVAVSPPVPHPAAWPSPVGARHSAGPAPPARRTVVAGEDRPPGSPALPALSLATAHPLHEVLAAQPAGVSPLSTTGCATPSASALWTTSCLRSSARREASESRTGPRCGSSSASRRRSLSTFGEGSLRHDDLSGAAGERVDELLVRQKSGLEPSARGGERREPSRPPAPPRRAQHAPPPAPRSHAIEGRFVGQVTLQVAGPFVFVSQDELGAGATRGEDLPGHCVRAVGVALDLGLRSTRRSYGKRFGAATQEAKRFRRSHRRRGCRMPP